ncbi:MAG TPA: PAS domain-containing sensor histidine kinase [Candidatus Thermoplasmatota archaeon]|nr:PAS domain-containing sensor histidine kinase [Candidatus Thermoplasmatota archaeon]
MALVDAALAKAARAEVGIAWVRAAVVAFNSLLYLVFLPRDGTHETLALAVIGVALGYAFFAVTLGARRPKPLLARSWAYTAADAGLIAVWIHATGGFESPFYVLWYVSLAAVFLRFDARATLAVAVGYAAAYLLLLGATGELAGHGAEVAVRATYILFLGALGALLARESLGHIRARLESEADTQAARVAEARFRRLVEGAPDPIVILDPAGRVTLANSRADSAFGRGRGRLVGEFVGSLLAGGPGRTRALASLAEARGTGDEPIEVTCARADGTLFDADLAASPLETAEGRFVTWIIRDTTERKRLEAERVAGIERMKELERLKELDEFKTLFINTAAHELGTPLTPIKLQIHVLRASPLSEPQDRAIRILERNVDRLSRLVGDVLEVAKLQAGRVGIERRPVDLNRVVFEAVESFHEAARQRSIRLEVRLDPDLQVEGDAKRLTQVLFNLLSNAMKFTPDGGLVEVETRRLPGQALVSVRDTGLGFTAEAASRLFQPFSQLHEPDAARRGGSGLGLYVSKGIVDLHGGHLWGESPGPGLGATFRFAVPFAAPAPVVPALRPRIDSVASRARELV